MRKILSFILSICLLFSFPISTLATEPILTTGGSPSNTPPPIPTVTDQTYTEWPSQKDVPVNKVWSIKFSSPVSASTVNAQNIYVVDSSGQKQNVTVTLATDTKTIQVTPIGNYKSGGNYTLYILKSVVSASSQTALKNNIRMEFTVTNVTIKSIADINVTTLIGTPPILPDFVDVTMSDGTTQSMKVKWQTLNLILFYRVSVKPVYGTLADFSYSVKANVSVVESDATISSINDITKTINQGDSYSLPTTVNATMSDTTTKSVNVTWSPSTADTSKAGTQTFNGSVVGYSGMVKLTITINSSAPTISSIADITHIILVKQGDACSLPSEVEATLSEGTKKQVPITWNPSIVDTSKVGRYTFLGSVEGTIVNGSKPTCTIIVKDPSELILPIGGILNGDNNWNNNTIYLQSDLTIKNQLSLGNVTIMGNGHRIINYGSINIYGDVIVINATLDIYQGSVQFGDNGRLEYM